MTPEASIPIQEKDKLFSQFLDESWSRLPDIISRLPRVRQLGYAKTITDLGIFTVVYSWPSLLQKATERQQVIAARSIPSYHLSDREARIYLMTVPGQGPNLYVSILKELGIYQIEDGQVKSRFEGALEFRTAMMALNASLPHNRMGSNPVTTASIEVPVIQKALLFIQKNFS